MNKNYFKYFLIILLFLTYSIFRLKGLFIVPFLDELNIHFSSITYEFTKTLIVPHPPLIFIINYFANLIFSSYIVTRLISVIFSTLSIILIYKIVYLIRSKSAAIWSLCLCVISSFFLFHSLIIDIDGPFLTFIFLISIYFYLLFKKTNSKKNLILLSVFFGIGLLFKYTSILIPIIIISYDLVVFKKFKKSIKLGFSFIYGLIIFSLFPLIAHIFNSPQFIETLGRGKEVAGTQIGNPILFFIQLGYFFVLITPLFLFPFFKKLSFKYLKEKLLFYIWIIVFFIFYMFASSSFAPLDRYFGPLIAPIIILSAITLDSFNFNRKSIINIVMGSIISFGLFLSLMFFKYDSINFYPKSNFISKLLNFDFMFWFPVTGSSGPLGYYIPFLSILLVFVLFILGFIIFKSFKNKNIRRILIISLISLVFGFNLFAASLLTFQEITYSGDTISKNMINDYYSNKIALPNYIFRNNPVTLLLNNSNSIRIDFDKEFNQDFIASIKGVIWVIDMPKINKKSDLWINFEKNCQLNKTFYDKDLILGYIYVC